MWSRFHVAPLLQAEEDRDQVRRYYADKEREKELLGSETKVYNSDRYVTHCVFLELCSSYLTSLMLLVMQLRPAHLRLYAYQCHQIN